MPGTLRAGLRAGPFPLFAILSLAAVAIGCLVARASGTAASEWARNLIAWVVGAFLAAGLARWAGPRVMALVLAGTPLGLAATLFSGGQAGVHRWLLLGPLHVNVAEVLAPVALVACAALGARSKLAGLAVGVALALMVLQPDASQATTLAGGLAVIALFSRGAWTLRLSIVGLELLTAAGSWLRPDPLAPVPEVEGVMDLARSLSPALAVAAWTALAGAMLAPLGAARVAGETRTAALALAAYGLLSALTPLAGAFPVPLVGMGMSPILGLWLGVGLLAGLDRRSTLTFGPPHAPFRAS